MSLARQLWGARRFEQFALTLREPKNVDEESRFTAESELLYQQYVQQRPKDVLTLAEFFAHGNQIDRALDLLNEHWAGSAPENIASVGAAVMMNVQSTAQQLDRLQQLLQAADKDPTGDQAPARTVLLSLSRADLMSWRGEYESAVKLYNDVLQRDRKNIAALNNLAAVLAMTGRDGQESFRLIQQAIDYVGPKAALLDTRGLAHLAMGVPAVALADFEEGLAGDSESVERRFHIALAYEKLKQSEDAKRVLSQAEKLGLTDEKLHPLERPFLAKLRKSLGI